MLPNRPHKKSLIGKDVRDVPMSLQRITEHSDKGEAIWVGPKEAAKMKEADMKAYEAAFTIMRHLCVRAPTAHSSGHPGGPLSSFTFAYFLSTRRDPQVDQPLRYSAGHLSLLAYGLQWMFGRSGSDKRLASIDAIIENFRIPAGLPGHVEAGIGDIPFGTGPLGKGVSNGLGVAFGLKLQKKNGVVDVLLADGDAQEGQVAEAFRLASQLECDNLVVHGDFNDIQLSDIPSKTMACDFAAIAYAEGWNVIEVQNGNDPAQVTAALDAADKLAGKGRPIFICYYTTMGHGVSFMEEGSNTGKKNYHGSPLSQEESDKAIAELPSLEDAIDAYESFRKNEQKRYTASTPTQTNIVVEWKPKGYARTVTKDKGAPRKDFGAVHLKNLMKNDERIIVLHADLAASGGFDKVQKEFPARVINVGVAEANMYMMAAGMRQTGLLPVTYTFASFGTNEARANARLIDVNCAHTRCGVLHDCTHAGLSVGEDGETHQEQNYLNIPFHNTQVWMPADCNQAAAMAEKSLQVIAEGLQSVYVFSPRTDLPQLTSPKGEIVYGEKYQYAGRADMVRGKGDNKDQVTIIATGAMVHNAIEAADRLGAEKHPISVRVINISCIRPIDAACIIQAALETQHLIVAEDHNTEGGLASQVANIIADFQLPCSLVRMGLRHYFPSGKAEDLLFFAGLDVESMVDAAQNAIKNEVCGGEDAFVSCLYMMLNNLHTSRFRAEATSFIEKLLEEKGYMEHLRDLWKSRTCPPAKLPKNDELRKRLGDSMQGLDL